MGRSRAEQETIIRWDRASDEATIWTAAPSVRNRLRRLGFDVRVFGGWCQATIPRNAVRLRDLSRISTRKRPSEASLRNLTLRRKASDAATA
jgi:hypothetical protein